MGATSSSTSTTSPASSRPSSSRPPVAPARCSSISPRISSSRCPCRPGTCPCACRDTSPGYQSHRPPTCSTKSSVSSATPRNPSSTSAGGCSASGDELRCFVELTGIPLTTTLMGIGNFPSDGPLSLWMLGMHGTVYANYAVDNTDLLLAFGVRFDDRTNRQNRCIREEGKLTTAEEGTAGGNSYSS
uniref:Thiamine pyrophosphate enzyme central domain-containing protein n=1 Tax=Oryza glaberrima TaxID=4538 RepID=I1Q6W2_ORYGL